MHPSPKTYLLSDLYLFLSLQLVVSLVIPRIIYQFEFEILNQTLEKKRVIAIELFSGNDLPTPLNFFT